MNGLPIISIKSKVLQADLGVKTVKSAKRKLIDFGVHVVNGEYVSKEEVIAVFRGKLESKMRQSTIKGSSFEDLID